MADSERNDSSDSLWEAADVAAYLKVQASTVTQWAQRGKIPFVRAGSLYRFRKADIDRWVEELAAEKVG